MASKREKSKESLINCEIKRLNKIFGLKGENAKGFQQELIQNAAFMAVSLRELQKIINENGYSDADFKSSRYDKGTFRPDHGSLRWKGKWHSGWKNSR